MKKNVVIPALLFGAVAAGGLFYLAHAMTFKVAAAVPPAPVPVVAGAVAQHDVPIYQDGVGTVIAYNTDVVNIISPTTTNGLVVVTQLDPISLIFTLPEGVLPQIQQLATKTPLPVIAYNQDDTLKLGTGVLALVNNEILQTTGSIQLKAT